MNLENLHQNTVSDYVSKNSYLFKIKAHIMYTTICKLKTGKQWLLFTEFLKVHTQSRYSSGYPNA